MTRISDADLVAFDRLQWYTTEDTCRLIAALREAYQEIAMLGARTAGEAPPGTPAVTTTNAIGLTCGVCWGQIVPGVLHACKVA